MEEYILTPNLQIKGKCDKLCISTNEKFIALFLVDSHLVLYQIRNKKWELYSDHLFNIQKNYQLETIHLIDSHQLILEIEFQGSSRIIRKETFVFLQKNNLWRRLFQSIQRILTSGIQSINISCFSIISVLTAKYNVYYGEGFFSFFQIQYRGKVFYKNAFECKILLFNDRINTYVYVIEKFINNKNESTIVSRDIKSQLSYSIYINDPVWTLAYDRANILQVYAGDNLFLYELTDQGFKLQFKIAIQLQKYGTFLGIPSQCQLIIGKYLRIVFWTEDFDIKGRKNYFNALIENELKNKQFTFQKRMPKKMQVKGFFLSALENIFILQESDKVFHLYVKK